LLETINNYGDLANMLIDTSLTQSDKAGIATLIGSNAYTTIYNVGSSGGAYAAGAAGTNTIVSIAGDRNGMSLSTTTAIANSPAYTFSLPILSGVVGCNASKMLCVGKLSAPIRCEFYLATNDDAVYYGTAGAGCSWQLVNVEFVACYVEVQDDSFVNDSSLQTEYISTTTYRHAASSIPASTAGEFTTLLPFRAASITALYARFRNNVTAVQGANATAQYRRGSSVNPCLSSVYWRVGSSIFPNKPIYLINNNLVGNGAEAQAELFKSFHALSSSIGNSSILPYQYNVVSTTANLPASSVYLAAYSAGANDMTTALNSSNNNFILGLELQSFSNRNDTILSGISTLNSQIYFTGIVYSGATTGASLITMDNYCAMDMILCIQDGVMSAKF